MKKVFLVKSILILLFLMPIDASTQELSNNLLLHYAFDGNSNDSSGNARHGSPSGVVYVADRNGNPNSAVYFDGLNDFIDLPNVSELKPDLPVSFSFWIKYDSEDYQDRSVFNTSFENDRSSGVFFNTQIASGNYAVNFGDGTYNYNPTVRRTLTSNEPIDTSSWHHIAVVVRSATDMNIYVNCIDSGGTYSGTGGDLVYSDTPGSLGRRDRNLNTPALYFKGMLDDFRYWNRAITISEINLLCLGEDPIVDDDSVTLFPNPTQDFLRVDTTIDFEQTLIFDAPGQEVYRSVFTPTIDVRSFSKGVYYLKLVNNNTVVNKKFVIE